MQLNNQPGDSVIILQDEKLKVITAKLNSVIEGNGVNCVDCEKSEGSGSNTIGGEDNEDTEGGSGTVTNGSGKSVEPSEVSGDDSGSGIIPVTKRPVKTKSTCHPNDPSCITNSNNNNNGGGDNSVASDDDSIQWLARQTDNKPRSSGLMVFSNSLLLLLCAVLAIL